MRVSIAALTMLMLASACQPQAEQPIVGTLERERVALTAEQREPITAIHVREGERVEAGTTLLELDTQRADAEHRRLAAEVERLQRRLDEMLRGPRRERIDQARARLEAAESNVETTRRERERIQGLTERDLASASALDQARNAHERAVAERDAARSDLEELLEGTTVEELDQARAALRKGQAALERQALTRERLTVRSPRPGIIEALPFERGETPQPGASVAIMHASDARPYARIHIPAALRERFRVGQTVELTVDGYGSQRGNVRFIASEATYTPYYALTEHDAGRLSYLAEIEVIDARELPAGVAVRMEPPQGD